MKGGYTRKIFELLGEGLMSATDIVEAILQSGYGASYSKMDKAYRRLESERIDRRRAVKEKQKFYNLISKLKREGFIVGKDRLRVTKLGQEKFSRMLILNRTRTSHYVLEGDGKEKIIIFDIPEKNKNRRDWLRNSLIQLGFKMLQKSVWVGKVKIPEDFLEDLKEMKLLSCVHIFIGEKLGTIDIHDA